MNLQGTLTQALIHTRKMIYTSSTNYHFVIFFFWQSKIFFIRSSSQMLSSYFFSSYNMARSFNCCKKNISPLFTFPPCDFAFSHFSLLFYDFVCLFFSSHSILMILILFYVSLFLCDFFFPHFPLPLHGFAFFFPFPHSL